MICAGPRLMWDMQHRLEDLHENIAVMRHPQHTTGDLVGRTGGQAQAHADQEDIALGILLEVNRMRLRYAPKLTVSTLKAITRSFASWTTRWLRWADLTPASGDGTRTVSSRPIIHVPNIS